MLTKRYQSGKLQAAWEEVKSDLRLAENVPHGLVDIVRAVFFAGAVFTATHLKYAEEILEEGLEPFDVDDNRTVQ